MALLIPADMNQQEREVKPQNGSDFQLRELYQLLSCRTLETRQLREGRIMILDEEGKLRDKPRNARATQLADFPTLKQLLTDISRLRETGTDVIWLGEPLTDMTTEVDYIAGDVLICNARELQ
jgi:hypothetical protein